MKPSLAVTLWESLLRSSVYRRGLRPWLDRHPHFKARWRARILRRLQVQAPPAAVHQAEPLPVAVAHAHGVVGVENAPHVHWAQWEAPLQSARQRLQESRQRP